MNTKHLVAAAFFILNAGVAAVAQTPILTQLCELPSEIYETSGLENGPNGLFWTHNDSGNDAELFCFDTLGTIHHTVAVVGDINVDWEEITKDQSGNLYIGNFGNNSVNRTDLRVMKIPSIDTCTTVAYVSDTIRFSYPDQSAFPPTGSYRNFDMEAFFHYQGALHLFSKDRTDPSTGFTKHYTLPDVGGTYIATLVDSFEAGHSSYIFAVTSADISEDGTQVALLSSDKIWLFRNFSGTDFFGGDVSVLSMSVFSQKEGICFRNGFLYFTDERSFGLGGKMYRLHPDMFVSVAEHTHGIGLKPVYNNNRVLQEVQLNTSVEYTWKLFDMKGRLLQNGSTSANLSAKELNQRAGMYILQFSAQGSTASVLIQL